MTLPATQPRTIAFRTKGTRHGPITRLMSPGDLGQLVKPFVFLDLFEASSFQGGFSAHPHSGIATHTTFLKGGVTYADSTGASGELHDGSVEWMRAGRGVWHTGQPLDGQPILGFQLWLALPPELELSPPESRYLAPETIPTAGNVRLLLGRYDRMQSPVELPVELTYLHVRLKDGERWIFTPPENHDIAWAATNAGRLHVSGIVAEREMIIFEEGVSSIEFASEGSTEFVIGSALRHAHDLVLGSYSVHTSQSALVDGERTILSLARTPEVQLLRA